MPYDYLLLEHKTNQLGEFSPDAFKPLRGSAAQAMSDWLAAAGINEGPLFRRITSSREVGAPLSDQAVGEIVTRRARAAGLEGRYTGHSLRAGFVTQAHLDGIPAPEGMAMSGHSSITVYNGYFRSGDDPESRIHTLVDIQ